MNPEQKLARIVRLLRDAGIEVLVMGGHAVRYFGVTRNTIDFDFVTELSGPEELQTRLPKTDALADARPIPVWRADDFARFQIGRLPDGREELIEFWIRNHLLDAFAKLRERAEVGQYGGEQLPFLSLADLMRSKETERESDWLDISLLEEIHDSRNLAGVERGVTTRAEVLAAVRSRRGMDQIVEKHWSSDDRLASDAIDLCNHPVPYAFLRPRAPNVIPTHMRFPIESTLIEQLSKVAFATSNHWTLIELVRRAYKRKAMERDRADKQARLGS